MKAIAIMATQYRGYYGLGVTSKTADFGLASSLTLPMVTPALLDDEVAGDIDSSVVPTEINKKIKKKKARFAPEIVEEQDSESDHQDQVTLRNKKPRSWRSRFSGLFKRNSKREEAEEALPVQEEPVGPSVAESDLPARTVNDSEVELRKAKDKRKQRKKRDLKSRSVALETSPYVMSEESKFCCTVHIASYMQLNQPHPPCTCMA